ncbi:hypothetical protein CASFOL_016774 [Castilleja foliolosa]|uniref:Uncharacterized protein n=1 Tax=Castilleja foliolosa TaxID=1961234 RepID=A0ABD3DDJ0_9LAMI
MDSNSGASSNNKKDGSVIPKEKEKVSTMVMKKIAKGIAKAGKAVADASKDHDNKSKVSSAD